MKRNDAFPARSIRRVNLSLPVVQTDSYEIYCTVPPSQTRQPSTIRPVSRQKPLIEIQNAIKMNNSTPLSRLPARLKNLTGPVLVDLFVAMAPVITETASTAADNISNALISSGYSGQMLRILPMINKSNQSQTLTSKEDSEPSQVTSSDRLLLDSAGSFEDPFMNASKKGMWQNINHPRFSTIKVLHAKKREQGPMKSSDINTRMHFNSSLFSSSQQSIISSNDQVYEKVEQLTKNFFPSIQQLRHIHPCPELISNRLHLHREQKRDFIPVLSRSRVGR